MKELVLDLDKYNHNIFKYTKKRADFSIFYIFYYLYKPIHTVRSTFFERDSVKESTLLVQAVLDNRKYCVWTLVNSEGKFISCTYKKKGRSWVIDTVQWIDYDQVKVGFHNYANMTNTIEELKTLGHNVDGVSVVDPH